ncbi:MAG: PD-(D/E)XK nuclease family protein, partial [Bacteroidota bacterium]
ETMHPIIEENNLNAVPFQHADIDLWRDNFTGVECTEPETGLVVSGAIDDVWQKPDGELIVVDYKATSKDSCITTLSDSPWDQQYKRQLGVYKWLLEQNGFSVSSTGYLLYANASKSESGFNDRLVFETTLVPVPLETDWILPVLHEIKDCLKSENYPHSGEFCEYCPYRAAAGKKLQAIHAKHKQ